jgi:predicted nucleic acid-binding protein
VTEPESVESVESILVDSNVFIDFLRAGKDPARELMKRFESTDLVTCGVVKAEVLRGVTSVAVRDKLEAFFDIMRFVETPDSVWNDTWQLAWHLDREGRVLPLTDICIAVCAQRAESAVLTSDRHFDRIPDLVVLKP